VGNIWEELTAELASSLTIQVLNIRDIGHREIQISPFSVIVGRGSSSSDISVQGIEVLRLRAVHIEPPVTDEVLLVEQSSVRTEEAVLYQGATAVIATDVECLAVCVLIRVVTFYLLITVKPGIRGTDEYRVVFPWDPGNVLCWKGKYKLSPCLVFV